MIAAIATTLFFSAELSFRGGTSQELARLVSDAIKEGVVLPPAIGLPSQRFSQSHAENFETKETPILRLLKADLIPTGSKNTFLGIRNKTWPMEIYPLTKSFDPLMNPRTNPWVGSFKRDPRPTLVKEGNGFRVKLAADSFLRLEQLEGRFSKPVEVHWLLKEMPVAVYGTFKSEKELLAKIAKTSGAVLQDEEEKYRLVLDVKTIRAWWTESSRRLASVIETFNGQIGKERAIRTRFDAFIVSQLSDQQIEELFKERVQHYLFVPTDQQQPLLVQKGLELVEPFRTWQDRPNSTYFQIRRDDLPELDLDAGPKVFLDSGQQTTLVMFSKKGKPGSYVGW